MSNIDSLDDIILKVENISKRYDGEIALNDISFSLKKGEILSFIGPNGAGKTTLLKILSGFLTSDSGDIFVNKEKVTNNLNKLNSLVSTVFGGGTGFYRNATVIENMYFFASLAGIRKTRAKIKINEVLSQVNLLEHRNKKIDHLSMGMLQRLHIARGLLKGSPIIVLDEPTNGVDVAISKNILDIVKKIANSGTSVILTSHILHEVSNLADKITLINNGSFLFSGDLNKIITASGVVHIDRPATLEESYLGLMEKLGGNDE